MRANELRLGNYLQLDGENYHVNEIQNSLQCVELKRKNLENPKINDYEECDLDCDDLLPIPLTEEILLKFGFEKVKNKDKEDLREYIGHTVQKAKYAIFGTDIFITKVDKRGLLRRSIECDFMVLFYHKSIPIKHLHQLQNLYFALTGQELEINL